MCKVYSNSKEVAKIFLTTRKHIDMIFRGSEIPTIHRNKNASKTLIEKENFKLLLSVVDKVVECYTGFQSLTSKQRINAGRTSFSTLLMNYKDVDTTQFSLIALDDDSLNVIVRYDNYFDKFIIHDFNTETDYEFGKSWKASNDTKNESNRKNAEHTVNGFWKNQPVGPRDNPSYKRIWIDGFKRGEGNNTLSDL